MKNDNTLLCRYSSILILPNLFQGHLGTGVSYWARKEWTEPANVLIKSKSVNQCSPCSHIRGSNQNSLFGDCGPQGHSLPSSISSVCLWSRVYKPKVKVDIRSVNTCLWSYFGEMECHLQVCRNSGATGSSSLMWSSLRTLWVCTFNAALTRFLLLTFLNIKPKKKPKNDWSQNCNILIPEWIQKLLLNLFSWQSYTSWICHLGCIYSSTCRDKRGTRMDAYFYFLSFTSLFLMSSFSLCIKTVPPLCLSTSGR